MSAPWVERRFLVLPARRRLVFPGLIFGLFVAVVTGLVFGIYPIAPTHILAALARPLHLTVPWQAGANERVVVLALRLPRVLLGVVTGAGLAVCGAALQAMFRNPLADPALVGVSSGAAVGAIGVMVFAGLGAAAFSVPLGAFVGGLLVTFLIYRVARFQGNTLVGTMLLAGIAVNAVAGAVIGILAYVAGAQTLRQLTFWLFGSLGKAGWTQVLVVLPLILIPAALIFRRANDLNILLLGEAEAGHLGVAVEPLKRQLILWVALAVGGAVAVSGIIGFVGLVVPHLVRLTLGPNHRRLLPASALLGATLLVGADTLSRTVAAPAELPIGILTALAGGPFFLWLLFRHRGRDLW